MTDSIFNPAPSIAAQVARVLEERIVYGELAPGSRLVEEELVETFQVSRSPVREALRLVEREGLVTIEQRRGARVSRISGADLDEVYSCRLALEGLATEQAAARCNDADAADLRHKLDTLESAYATGDPKAYFEANVILTNAIHSIAKSVTLSRLIGTIDKQAYRYRFLAYREAPELMQRSIEVNRDIVAAVCSKRTRLARTLMEEVLTESWRKISTILRERNLVEAADGAGDLIPPAPTD